MVKIQCTVCCHYYTRDCDLVEGVVEGLWTCESNDARYAPLDCGFSVAVGTSAEEILRLAKARIAELRAMGAPRR